MSSKHIVLIAGEASGDQHAGKLITELGQNFRYSGIGGKAMQTAGVDIIYDLAQFGVTGITEVIRQFSHIRHAFQLMKKHLQNDPPDLLILVDYSGFNLRIAKFAKQLNIKILYYISPQIWAWRAKRIKTIQQCVDMMAVILPFEKQIYQDAKVAVRFVGHPLTETAQPKLSEQQARKKFNLRTDSTVIGLLPGSRSNELKYLLPVIIDAARRLKSIYPDVEFIMPIASTVSPKTLMEKVDQDLNIHCVQEDSIEVMNCCHSLIIASGTATLEAALLTKPMVIIYKTSFLTAFIARAIAKLPYLGLCNLLSGEAVVPELLQEDLTSENLSQQIEKYLDNPDHYQQTISKLEKINGLLSSHQVDCSLSDLVLELLEPVNLSKAKPAISTIHRATQETA